MKVLVMGGGLAGLSSAVHLLDNGFEVTLIEAEKCWEDALPPGWTRTATPSTTPCMSSFPTT